jgi:hypothetical protein
MEPDLRKRKYFNICNRLTGAPLYDLHACSDRRSGIDFRVQEARGATALHCCYDAARDRGDARPAYLPGRAAIVGSQDDVLELAQFLGNEGVVGRRRLTVEMAKGFSLYMVKAIMSGRGDEIIDLAKTNLWR